MELRVCGVESIDSGWLVFGTVQVPEVLLSEVRLSWASAQVTDKRGPRGILKRT